MSRRFWMTFLPAGFYLAAWLTLSDDSLGKGLETNATLGARRFKESVDLLVQKAYHAKDDLGMQEIIQALARAPGVLFACVMDRDEKVLSHSRVSQLSKPFRLPAHARDIYSFPLRDEQSRWGTLVFSMSKESERRLRRQHILLDLGAAMVLCLGILGWSLSTEKRLHQLAGAIAERDSLLTAEKSNFRRLEERLESAREAWKSLAQSAVRRAPGGLLILDMRQRVAACNLQAALLLGAVDEAGGVQDLQKVRERRIAVF